MPQRHQWSVNANMEISQIESVLNESSQLKQMAINATERMNLAARVFHRAIRVARAIADLDGSKQIGTKYLVEALGYRQRLFTDK